MISEARARRLPTAGNNTIIQTRLFKNDYLKNPIQKTLFKNDGSIAIDQNALV